MSLRRIDFADFAIDPLVVVLIYPSLTPTEVLFEQHLIDFKHLRRNELGSFASGEPRWFEACMLRAAVIAHIPPFLHV